MTNVEYVRGDLPMAMKYYVAKTKPCHEAIAQANLAAKGFEAYVPTVREEIRTRTQRLSTLRPMFPGYIFVRLDLTDPHWRAAHSARGVMSLMGPHPERPTAVPERAMAWVYESEANENAKHAMGPVAHVAAGDEVTVTMKNGKTIDGVCQMSAKDRVTVLMMFLGEAREIDVDPESVTRRAS